LMIFVLDTMVRAQIIQPERFEIELKPFENYFEVISLKDEGLVIYRETDGRSKDGKKWQIIRLDADLKPTWEQEYYFPYAYDLVGYSSRNERFYLLFNNDKTGKKHLELFEFFGDDRPPEHYTIENLFAIHLTHFEVSDSAAIIGGYYNYRPVVMHYNLSNDKSIVLPGIYNNKTELIQIKVFANNSYSIIVTEQTKDKRNTLAIKSYDASGDMIINTTLDPPGGNNIIFGRIARTNSNTQLIAGTYSSRRSDYSRGLFIAYLDDTGKQNINYYNYGDFENFFNYMRAKRQKRVQDRITRKKIAGKKVKFNYRLMVHDIIKQGDKYLMLGEAFYPKYSHTYRSGNYANIDYSALGPGSTSLYLEGYRYTHAVVIGFDNKGRLLWDNSFEITDVISPTLDQYVNVGIEEDKIVLLYLYENEIRSKIIKNDEVLEGKELRSIELKFDDDITKNTDFEVGGLEKWHDNYFVAYGVQKIKNLRDTGVKLNRRVFFVNKLVYQ